MSYVEPPIPPTITISFSADMLASPNPYLASPTSGPICHTPSSVQRPTTIPSRRLSGKRKYSEVEDQRPPAITTTVELAESVCTPEVWWSTPQEPPSLFSMESGRGTQLLSAFGEGPICLIQFLFPVEDEVVGTPERKTKSLVIEPRAGIFMKQTTFRGSGRGCSTSHAPVSSEVVSD